MLSDPEKIAINTVFVCFLFHVISWFNILTLPRIIYTVIHSAPRLSLSGSHQVATGAESLWSLQFGDFSELCPSAFPHNGFNGLQDLTPRNHIAQNLWSSKSLQTWKSGLKGVIVHNPWIQTLLRSAHTLHQFLECHSSYSLLGVLTHLWKGGIWFLSQNKSHAQVQEEGSRAGRGRRRKEKPQNK